MLYMSSHLLQYVALVITVKGKLSEAVPGKKEEKHEPGLVGLRTGANPCKILYCNRLKGCLRTVDASWEGTLQSSKSLP